MAKWNRCQQQMDFAVSYVRVGKKWRRLAWGRPQMMTLANAAVMAITVRSFDRGLGVDDRPHKPKYTARYKNRKKKSGRNVAKIDLTWSGRLRQSIRPIRVSDDRAVISPTGNAKIYGTFVNELRPFMYLSPRVSNTIRLTARALLKAASRGG